MNIKALLLRSAAVGAMALAVPLAASIPLATPAAAAGNVDVSINIGTFYDRLSPHGDWVSLNGRTVWVPAGRPAQWQPYTLGHWAYTNRYGWMWVSAEPFGWATYHYGRWSFAEDIGWYWAPGYRWAPAWVSWRRSDDYVAWSPLPVDYPDEFGVNITIGAVPDSYWQVVPSRSFLSVNLFGVIIHDRHRADTFIRNARPMGGVRIVNNVIVNNVIDVNFVEKRTHKKVRVYKIQEAKTLGKGTKVKGDSIEVFQPQVKKGGQDKPKQVKSVDEVKARYKKDVGTSQDNQQPKAIGQTGKKNKEKVQKQTTQPQTGDQSGKKKQDKVQEKTTQSQTAGQSVKKKEDKLQKKTNQTQTGDQSDKKKKQDKVQQQTAQQPNAADQTDKKKKQQDQQQPVVQ